MTPPIRERVDQPRNWREDDGKKPLVGKLLCSSWHEVNMSIRFVYHDQEGIRFATQTIRA